MKSPAYYEKGFVQFTLNQYSDLPTLSFAGCRGRGVCDHDDSVICWPGAVVAVFATTFTPPSKAARVTVRRQRR